MEREREREREKQWSFIEAERNTFRLFRSNYTTMKVHFPVISFHLLFWVIFFVEFIYFISSSLLPCCCCCCYCFFSLGSFCCFDFQLHFGKNVGHEANWQQCTKMAPDVATPLRQNPTRLAKRSAPCDDDGRLQRCQFSQHGRKMLLNHLESS